jgi:hypothetical protein
MRVLGLTARGAERVNFRMPEGTPPLMRLMRRVTVDPDGCWVWGGPTTSGYSAVGVGRTTVGGHRLAYTELVGPIPAGHEIDHLCRNRRCVNPAHLEPVTKSENKRRAVEALR